jgi:hypothetical protein
MHGCAVFARPSYAFQGEGSGRGARSPNACQAVCAFFRSAIAAAHPGVRPFQIAVNGKRDTVRI